ncbi:type II toxin-antitoxin system VapC family toxin [Anabaena sp. AL93]|uniref:type II toxin-antitoxin system VapC family toxin n=1 Tax=Anabaena sp. AL93 TaxID=1678133 RepID=UPI0007FE2A48|nr:PIN domain-containing protein [Anabaena sp. AL93]OBQ15620.1 MAG: nucleic acid-binding protein [Anabaena sp. AL93]
MILCDAGPLFALVDNKQSQHVAIKKAVMKLSIPLITTWPCFTEAMYLALRRGGWAMQNQLGKLITNDMLTFYEVQATDYERLFELIKKYQDRPMDLADGILVIAVERLQINRILTLDSDFFFYLINDSEPFNVINLNDSK